MTCLRLPPALLGCVLALGSVSVTGEEPVVLKRSRNQIEVRIGTQPFTAYYFGPESPKPYFHPLRSAQGTVVTRGYPMRKDIAGESPDHPHHRGMFFAHGDVNGVDFWSEAEFEERAPVEVKGKQYSVSEKLPHGRTVFRRLEEMKNGLQSGTLRALFDLTGPRGKVIAQEIQSYVFHGDEHNRIIDCAFTVHALEKPVKMGDTKEGTFAIRVVKALEEPAVRMADSNGRVGEKQIWGKRAKWVDYSGSVEGEKVGIAIFDHPSNPKYPTYWHARGYGLFAVNPFGERDFYNDKARDGSLTIPAGQSLTFRYRVLIHHGDASEVKVAEAYERYAVQK